MKKRYVVGVTGASGVVYARRLLEVLSEQATVYLVVSEIAEEIARHEEIDLSDLPVIREDNHNLAAEIASGSFKYDGMVVVPCSMKTLASVSTGLSSTLIARAADVCLKEKRRCILVMREMPLSRVHLKNMLAVDEAGATVMVASPPFYGRPQTIDDLVDMVVARILDHLGVEHDIGTRWSGYDDA